VKKESGYYRYKKGNGFSYQNELGQTIVSKPIRKWIESLVIPPAWKNVWISKDRQAHLLATGYDMKNRKQYHYHEQWTEIREAKKHARLVRLGSLLPRIRRTLRKDIGEKHLSHKRVLASIVEIIDATGMRMGNAVYTRDNSSYGVTTLRKKHVSGSTVKEFQYTAKSGKERTIVIDDPKIIKVITECEETPGLELFKYFDVHDVKQSISSDEVNQYIHSIAKKSVTAKDFRNWYGSVHALEQCIALGECNEKCAATHTKTIFTPVSKMLGNTAKIAADSYIHEAVMHHHTNNSLAKYQCKATKWRTMEEELLVAILADYDNQIDE
jgi:DNA topoisomerase-1